MALLSRIFRLIWGDDVDRAVRPVLAVNFAGAISGSAAWTFMGIWAIKELGASSGTLGIAYLAGALLAGVSGYVGGHLSDRRGRRPLILFGWGGGALYFLLFLTAGHTVLLGLGLMAGAGVLGSLGGSSTQALVADLVHPERREAAYASLRVAQNLGVVGGPPIGSLFLLLGGWHALFIGVSCLSSLGFLLAVRFLPRTGAYAPEAPPQRGSFAAIRGDRVFLLFLGSGVLAQLTYVAFETVLPVSLVDSHGLSASTWGFLVILNPAMVTVFQLRLTRRVAHVSPAVKLSTAMVLMGFPFLLLSASSAIPIVLVVIFVFVIGEMLWVPTSQSVIAALAPADIRGAYMGAFMGSGAAGFALAPFLGLQVREGFGDSAMWGMFAAISLVGAVAGAIACLEARGRSRPDDLPAEPAAA